MDFSVKTVSCEALLREVMQTPKFFPEVVKLCGSAVVKDQETRELDRQPLSELLFKDAALLQKLEKMMEKEYGDVLNKNIQEATNSGCRMIFLEASEPRHWQGKTDCFLLVTATGDVRGERVMKRNGLSREEAEAKVNSQTVDPALRKQAASVIDTDSLDFLALQERARTELQKLEAGM